MSVFLELAQIVYDFKKKAPVEKPGPRLDRVV